MERHKGVWRFPDGTEVILRGQSTLVLTLEEQLKLNRAGIIVGTQQPDDDGLARIVVLDSIVDKCSRILANNYSE